MSEREDLELLESWRDGDQRAGTELFGRHFDALYRFFRSKLEHQAEDLVQLTFLACVRNRETFRGDSSFRSYLYCVARSKLYDALRKRARGTDVSMCTMADLRASPSSWLARKSELQLVQVALEQLPLELQLAVELFYFEELSAREVAEALDIPEGTVRSRLRRALDDLRGNIEKLAATDEQAQKTLEGLDHLVGSER
ncbi:MAG: RNA polymerase sigma factor [Myxococcales bacterium]|nr:RNA polymerase sigma factor [Myxococcales bacterium]